jgi:hypothetical protein
LDVTADDCVHCVTHVLSDGRAYNIGDVSLSDGRACNIAGVSLSDGYACDIADVFRTGGCSDPFPAEV